MNFFSYFSSYYQLFRDLRTILTRKQKKNLLLCQSIAIANSLVQPFLLLPIFPFIFFLTDFESTKQNEYYQMFQNFTAFEDKTIVILAAFVVMGFLVFGLLLEILTLVILKYLTARMNLDLEIRMFNLMLSQPYSEFISKNASLLRTKASTLIIEFCTKILSNIISINAQINLLLAYLIFTLIIDPFSTIIIIVTFSTVYIIILKVFAKKSQNKGAEFTEINLEKHKVFDLSVNSIREIKLRLIEPILNRIYYQKIKKRIGIEVRLELYSSAPKFLIMGAIFCCMIVISTSLFFSSSNESALSKITVFGFAGLRIMFVLNSIYNSFIQLLSGKQSYAYIKEDMKQTTHQKIEFELKGIKPLAINKSIKLKNIYFSYSDKKDKNFNYTLNDVSLTIPAKHSVGIVGLSGSGKTTLVDMITGLIEPNQGTIYVDGLPIDDDNKYNFRKNISFVSQSPILFNDSIRKNIVFFNDDKEQYNEEHLNQCIEVAELTDLIDKMPKKLDTIIADNGASLSGGQRQRMMIARALFVNTDLLILDEATSSLDVVTENKIVKNLDIFTKSSKTKIIIAHRLSTVKNCDLLYFMKEGKVLAQGNFKQLYNECEEFKTMVNLGKL